MPHPISALGAAHTIISLVPFVAGVYCFVRYRKIDSDLRAARVYLFGLTLTVFTSFGLSSTGGVNAGHVLGILALLSVCGAIYAHRAPRLSPDQPYLSQFGFTFSFFLLMVPGINETLTRLPVDHPLAEGPTSPVVRGALAAWLIVFVAGSLLQGVWTRLQRKSPSSCL